MQASFATCRTVSSPNAPEHSCWAHLPAFPQLIVFMHSGPWRVLLTTCNILPILSLLCLANTPIPYSGLRHVFSVDVISDSKWQRWPHNILYWARKHSTRSIILFFFHVLFVPYPPVFGLFHLTTNSQLYKIPHNECHENNQPEIKLNTKINTKAFTELYKLI